MKKLLFILCSLLCPAFVFTQYHVVNLEEKINQSDLIIEGRVIKKEAYEKDGRIYTDNTLEICDVIYNRNQTSSSSTVNVITYGGQLGEDFNTWSHTLTLHEGDEGLFFLKQNTDIVPDNSPTGIIYYEVYAQEQGAILYAKDDSYDFIGRGLFTNINNPSTYIASINGITGQTLTRSSCIQQAKSGVTLKIDTVFIGQNGMVIRTSAKGHWSRSYEIEKVKIRVKFATPVTVSTSNISIVHQNPAMQSHYISSWLQQGNQELEIEYAKNTTATYQTLATAFDVFLQLTLGEQLLAAGIESIELVESSYHKGGNVLDFLEYEIKNNHWLKGLFPTPNIMSFSPAEVCAGIKMDQSAGTPMISGHILIKGENFDDLNPADFATLIPNDYRVEFKREQDLGSNAFKVTPLPEDYVFWTDTLIKVRVPTYGWLVNNNNIISQQIESANAVTGRVYVRNPDGVDNTGNNEVKVLFANFNSDNSTITSTPHRLINRSTNGGYYFVFDPSFDQIYPENITAAKQDVIDAFCEWNALTEIKLEVLDTCPVNPALCATITYKTLPATSSSAALAAGIGNITFSCPGELAVGAMELRFSNQITNWRPSTLADPNLNPNIINAAAIHEIGHLLRHGHVYNDDATMHPFYSNTISIDTDAEAGGTHISNVSAALSCSVHLVQGIVCTTPTNDINTTNHYDIHPNPTKDIIEISFDRVVNNISFDIYNLIGEVVYTGIHSGTATQIDISNFASGTYFVVFRDKHLQAKKIIKL